MNASTYQYPTMLPYDTVGLFEKPRIPFKMPKVVPDQKSKFEAEELFKRLSRETEVRYTSYRDRPLEERQIKFQNGCRDGHIEIAFTVTGTNIQLTFSQNANGYNTGECDFDKEHGKVHLNVSFIFNGVCVRWRGYMDLERLDGVGCLEFDEDNAQIEDALLREQIEKYNRKLREFEEKQRAYRSHHDRQIQEEVRQKTEISPSHSHN